MHGRRAVSHLTVRALVKARIKNKASRSHAVARLFADGHEIAQTRFTVRAFSQSANSKHPVKRHSKKPASNSASSSPSTPVSPTPTPTVVPAPGTTSGLAQPVAPSARAQLVWAPPALTSPTTVYVKSGDPDVLKLSTSKDYIVKMPAYADTGTVEIDGGHNVELIGGQITVPSTANQSDNGADNTDSGIYIKGSTGTVHIEGMLISGQGYTMFDGIDINAPQATVQIENVRMTGVWGSYSSEHADVIQTWGGVKALRVDGLTAQGDYQGLSVDPTSLGSVGQGQFQNVNMTAEPPPAALASRYIAGGVMLWLTNGNSCKTTPMSFSNVYIDNETGRVPSGSTVWPTVNSSLSCSARQSGNAVTWPGLPSISGSVVLTAPPGGDFVPAGAAGVGYQTPGY